MKLSAAATAVARRNDLLGKHFLELVPESQAELTSDLFMRVVSGEVIRGELLHIIRGDGRQRLLELDATLVLVEGEPQGVFGVVRDISDEPSNVHPVPRRAGLSLNTLIGSMQPVLRRALGPHVELSVEATAAPDLVEIDRDEAEQLIIDFVLNARRALPKGGALSVKTSFVSERFPLPDRFGTLRADAYVSVTITDDGSGFPQDALANIFGDPSGGATSGSTLVNARGIVDAVGGHVSVLSERVGTVFRVYLPSAAPPPEAPMVVDLLTDSAKILVVDDDDFIRRTCSDILERVGHRVVQTANAEQALLAVDEDPEIAAAVVNVVLPSTGGRELAALLQQRRPKLPVVFTAGYSDAMIRRHRILEQEHLYVQKPFTGRELLEVTGAALKARPAN